MADFRAEVGKLQQPPINMKMRKKINEWLEHFKITELTYRWSY
jgi:hypothetical protein